MLRSERLVLERFTPEFITDAYVRWMNDPEVRRWLVSGAAGETTRADLQAYVASIPPDAIQFAMLHQGTHIGNIKIYDWDPEHRRMEVGYLVGERECWGRGFATEAVRRVVDFCFDDLRLHKMTSGCFAGHEASARVLMKAGFTLEGTLRDHFLIAGRWIDFRRFGRVAAA
jgi:[ribosomal protein S5]-alanine N-acetyltransferase